MISKEKINSDEYLKQGLLEEIKIMKKLSCDYVVKLLDVLETSNNYYIMQQFCDGGDFSQ
jgi:serine/threonine protein kinase